MPCAVKCWKICCSMPNTKGRRSYQTASMFNCWLNSFACATDGVAALPESADDDGRAKNGFARPVGLGFGLPRRCTCGSWSRVMMRFPVRATGRSAVFPSCAVSDEAVTPAGLRLILKVFRGLSIIFKLIVSTSLTTL